MRQLVEWIYVSVCLCLGKGEKGASESPVFDSRRSRKVKGREGGGEVQEETRQSGGLYIWCLLRGNYCLFRVFVFVSTTRVYS